MDTIAVKVRDIVIGGNTPIKVQTMCNTHTQDIEESVAQCVEMANAGADIIRLTTQGLKEVEALKVIKEKLISQGINVPLVCSIIFSFNCISA
ncbi:MAG: flavodoxin-dependent (E)-4-hydroxy-3-methylbut-2-enyl-diphosphate synthase, partial [Bacteroidales bacterium]|nr:flavodoxin-dependent (E)-4-hydroxy-3-methylbut-2-enyl-diphosphate synthase [Bacteroidales bacterium]